MKTINILLMTLSLILVSCANTPELPEECYWEAGMCEMAIGPGYYYEAEQEKCEYFAPGSGCSQVPFNTLEECQQTCEVITS